MKKTFPFIIFLILIGCGVPKSDYEKIVNENKELRQVNEKLTNEIDSLKQAVNSRKVICNEEVVAKELKSYLEFYCPDCLFKDFKIRKIDDCIFDINIRKKSKDNQPYDNWISVIVRMTFTNNGKYTVEDVEGSHRWACDGL